ncbi:MAG: hypothetical protein V2A54_13055 [Bacteroidota bacterium]
MAKINFYIQSNRRLGLYCKVKQRAVVFQASDYIPIFWLFMYDDNDFYIADIKNRKRCKRFSVLETVSYLSSGKHKILKLLKKRERNIISFFPLEVRKYYRWYYSEILKSDSSFISMFCDVNSSDLSEGYLNKIKIILLKIDNTYSFSSFKLLQNELKINIELTDFYNDITPHVLCGVNPILENVQFDMLKKEDVLLI